MKSLADDFVPTIWNPQVPGDLAAIELRFADPATIVTDTYEAQLRDLLKTRSPREDLDAEELGRRVAATHPEGSLREQGRWIYYPWSRRLVHLLPRDEFRELRSNRNQHKILAAEQARLRDACIGIVGLSVGHSAAMTLALEGIGGRFRLADFDVLDLSNLNRIRTGVHNLGVNKAVLAAREMYELDPYLEIEIFAEGINEDNLDSFFGGAQPLQLLVEECDDLFAKVRLRERARELGLPVLMDTSDGGLLDIERFDLEPNRELFHGVIPDLRAEELIGLTTTEKVPFVLAILGTEQMTREFAGSLVELKKTISTWPQLGSSVTLGGALIAHAARHVLLDKLRCSGRFSVDLGALLTEEAAQITSPQPLWRPLSEEVTSLPSPPATPSAEGLDRATIEYFLEFAIRAPSAGNSQPWKFRWNGEELLLRLDGSRSSFLDFEYGVSAMALGAALENISLIAQKSGYSLSISSASDPLPYACSLRFADAPAAESALLPYVFQRATNRHFGDRSPLTASEVQGLEGALGRCSARVHVLTNRDALDRVGELLGEVDKLRFLSPTMHAELVSELRWTPEEALSTRDGIDLATLGMSDADLAVMRILARGDVMRWVADNGYGSALAEQAAKGCHRASGLALLTIPRAEGDMLEAGRWMQTLWLKATQLGLAVCPQGVFLLLARIDGGETRGLSNEEVVSLRRIGRELRELLGSTAQEKEVMLLRLSHAVPPAAFALRRDLSEVFVE